MEDLSELYDAFENSETKLTENHASTLLKEAIADGKVSPPPDNILRDLQGRGKRKAYQRYLRETNKNHEEFSLFIALVCVDSFARLVRGDDGRPIWNFVGDPKGSDVDIFVLVTKQKPLFPGEVEAVKEDIILFDPSLREKEFDISYISWNGPPGRKTAQFDKGPESVNIGYHTYNNHDQLHPPLFKREDLNRIWQSSQLLAFGKFVIDKAKFVYGDRYKEEFQPLKKSYYHRYPERNQITVQVLRRLAETPPPGGISPLRRILKSIVLKFSQIIAAEDPNYHLQKENYNKKSLAVKMGVKFPRFSEEFLRTMLYRENPDYEVPPGFILWMTNMYEGLVRKHFPIVPPMRELTAISSAWNPTDLPNHLWYEWRKSPRPNAITDRFAEGWIEEYGEGDDIGSRFMEKIDGVPELLEAFPHLGKENRLIKHDPRSQQWVDFYKSGDYITGRHTGVSDLWEGLTPVERIKSRGNLIGGNFGEAAVIYWLKENASSLLPREWKLLRIINVGGISRDGPGTETSCPDFLLLVKGPHGQEVIPGEIKTFQMEPTTNKSFFRGHDLARLQVWSAMRALNAGTVCSRRGLMIFLFLQEKSDEREILGHIHHRWFVATDCELRY